MNRRALNVTVAMTIVLSMLIVVTTPAAAQGRTTPKINPLSVARDVTQPPSRHGTAGGTIPTARGARLQASEHGHEHARHGRTRPGLCDLQSKMTAVLNALAVELRDHVAALEAGLLSGALRLHVRNDDS